MINVTVNLQASRLHLKHAGIIITASPFASSEST